MTAQTRAKRVDLALVAIFVPLWLAALTLHLRQVATDRLAWVGVFVSQPSAGSELPRLREFWPGSNASDLRIQVGDELVSIGTVPLAGVGPVDFLALAYEQLRQSRTPVLRYKRGAITGEAPLPTVPIQLPWRMVPVTCAFVLAGTMVLLRRPGARVSRAFFLATIAYAVHWTFFLGGTRGQTIAWLTLFVTSSTLMFPLILRPVFLFPDQIAPVDGRLPRWPWIFSLFGVASLSWVVGFPLPAEVGLRLAAVLNVAFIATLLFLLTSNLQRCDPLGQRQLKWVVLGFYVGMFPVLVGNVVTALQPELWWVQEIAVLSETLLPVCIFIAIARYHLFDLDRLITTAAIYSALSVVLVALLLTVVPATARAMSASLDLDATTGQLGLTLLLAGGLVPLQRALQPRIEGFLFSERHALERGFEQLLSDLSTSSGPQALLTLAVQRLSLLLQPTCAFVYGRAEEAKQLRLAPLMVHGLLDGAELELPELDATEIPIDLTRRNQVSKPIPLEADDLPSLRHLGARLLLPVWRGNQLRTMICLGGKRSGDIYTPIELTLLAAVTEKLSAELIRFDDSELLRHERAMRDALERYVPSPVARAVAAGEDLGASERVLSVLFVDIRGYTALSEANTPEATFEIINRFTELASQAVREHGGAVIQFLGDGLFALFGAPTPLPRHAKAAVAAGRALVEAARQLSAQAAAESQVRTPIRIGVGIATGAAFVGNLRKADGLVYTAIGDTVNLASRLQELTRELDASIAIDIETHSQASPAANDFSPRPGAILRGRREPIDLFVLPEVVEREQ